MSEQSILDDPEVFSEKLYERMKRINPGIEELELYEFRYALDNLYPHHGGWASIRLDGQAEIEDLINRRSFYVGVQLKPRIAGEVVLDENIIRLTRMLFVGLITGAYPEEWVRAHFYFDIRGFHFLVRTVYFTPQVLAHFGGKPFVTFERKQARFERSQDIGYKAFKEANAEVDQFFMDSVKRLISAKGTPILMTIAGPTAAGKTEIVARLRSTLEQAGLQATSIEMDNFMTDRDYRDDHGIDSMGPEAFHFELFMQSVRDLLQGQKTAIPRYVSGVSSHDLDGNLREGCTPIEIDPADIIFIEGNFPFQLEEVAQLIGIKVVYLTDDPIRLKRKWKRDIDYRMKYDTNYFRNRFFRTQFLRACDCYLSQMEVCDMVVDTTGAALWATPEIARLLSPA